jgi:hypothetical protein
VGSGHPLKHNVRPKATVNKWIHQSGYPLRITWSGNQLGYAGGWIESQGGSCGQRQSAETQRPPQGNSEQVDSSERISAADDVERQTAKRRSSSGLCERQSLLRALLAGSR